MIIHWYLLPPLLTFIFISRPVLRCISPEASVRCTVKPPMLPSAYAQSIVALSMCEGLMRLSRRPVPHHHSAHWSTLREYGLAKKFWLLARWTWRGNLLMAWVRSITFPSGRRLLFHPVPIHSPANKRHICLVLSWSQACNGGGGGCVRR